MSSLWNEGGEFFSPLVCFILIFFLSSQLRALPFHLVMDLAADNGLDPYARALVDSLKKERWPDDWTLTLLLDARGPHDTLYLYRYGVWSSIPRQEISSGDPYTLRDLLMQTGRVPDEQTPWIVVLWGHGNGWFRETPQGWGQDWSPSGALEWVNGEVRLAFLNLPRKPDWLFFDACAMGQMEVLGAVCPSVQKVGASLTLMPSDGLPWLHALRFARTFDVPVEQWLDSLLVWYERLHPWYPVTYTVWDCQGVMSWITRWKGVWATQLPLYHLGLQNQRVILSLPGPSFFRPGLDPQSVVVDLPMLLDTLGETVLREELEQTRIQTVGSDSAYRHMRGPGVWRPPSGESFRLLMEDYMRLTDGFSPTWLALLQGAWGPDTLPPVWENAWIRLEQKGNSWWGHWSPARDPLAVEAYEVRLYRADDVASGMDAPVDMSGSVIPENGGWRFAGNAWIRWKLPGYPVDTGKEFWIKTLWTGRTGPQDTLWVNGNAVDLQRVSPGRNWVHIDSLLPDSILEIRVSLTQGHFLDLVALSWFAGRMDETTLVWNPSVIFSPRQDPGLWILWVRALDLFGNRSVPIWNLGNVLFSSSVRMNGDHNRWEVWIPRGGARVWLMRLDGRVVWTRWLQTGWQPLPRLPVAGAYRVRIRGVNGGGGTGVLVVPETSP